MVLGLTLVRRIVEGMAAASLRGNLGRRSQGEPGEGGAEVGFDLPVSAQPGGA